MAVVDAGGGGRGMGEKSNIDASMSWRRDAGVLKEVERGRDAEGCCCCAGGIFAADRLLLDPLEAAVELGPGVDGVRIVILPVDMLLLRPSE